MKVLVFSNGVTKEITGDAGKYWLCGEERFRKAGKQFLEVRDVPEAEEPVEIQPKSGEKRASSPKKRASRKKKEAGVVEDGECGE